MSEPKKRAMRHLDVSKLSDTMKALNPHLYEPPADFGKIVMRQPGEPLEVPTKKKPRRAKEPNQTEREYEAILKRQFPGAVIRWEALTLRLADRCTYSPDYIVFLPNGSIECHEVKGGFIFPKALVKPRMAAEAFPWRFVLAQKRKGGEWEISTLNGIWTRNNP